MVKYYYDRYNVEYQNKITGTNAQSVFMGYGYNSGYTNDYNLFYYPVWTDGFLPREEQVILVDTNPLLYAKYENGELKDPSLTKYSSKAYITELTSNLSIPFEFYFKIGNTTIKGSVTLESDQTFSGVPHVRYTFIDLTSLASKSSLISSSIVAENGTYPSNGVHTDGYWYVRKGVVNTAPTISGSNINLGSSHLAPVYTYTVNDVDTGNTLTITEEIDGVTTNTFTATRNATYTAAMTNFDSLSLGVHTLVITVSDGTASTSRSIAFTKVDDRIIVRGKTPVVTTKAAEKIVASGVFLLQAGSGLSIEACNNGFDANPTWEDITASYLENKAHIFTNKVKTAENWGVNYRFTLLKGSSTAKSYIHAFGLNFN